MQSNSTFEKTVKQRKTAQDSTQGNKLGKHTSKAKQWQRESTKRQWAV